ncbi:hypothetical protein D9M70_653520 [compost metagenome]
MVDAAVDGVEALLDIRWAQRPAGDFEFLDAVVDACRILDYRLGNLLAGLFPANVRVIRDQAGPEPEGVVTGRRHGRIEFGGDL